MDCIVHGATKSWTRLSNFHFHLQLGFPHSSVGKNLPAMQETRLLSLSGEDLLKKTMATLSSILAWRIPWMEEPGRLQSVGS